MEIKKNSSRWENIKVNVYPLCVFVFIKYESEKNQLSPFVCVTIYLSYTLRQHLIHSRYSCADPKIVQNISQ